jgi:hypothetical protein
MKTVAVSKEVWEEIRNRGKMGQTFDQVLREILKVD